MVEKVRAAVEKKFPPGFSGEVGELEGIRHWTALTFTLA